jgi:hypothetical protein
MDQELHPVFIEALDELQLIENLLLEKTNRKLSTEQVGIIVRKRFSAIINAINRAGAENLSVEERTTFYQLVLPKFNAIINNMPEDDLAIFWYQLHALRLSMIANIMAAWGEGGLLRTIGIANAIPNILMGVDTIDPEEVLVEKDHSEFLTRNSLSINLNNFYAGLHYIISTTLYSIKRERLEEWGMKALIGNQKMFTIIARVWDIPLSVKFDKRLGENRTLNLCQVLINIFNAMIRYLLVLVSRFGDDWPELDKRITFLDASSDETIIASLEGISKKRDEYIADLQHHATVGTIVTVTEPLAEPRIRTTLIFSEMYNYVIQGLGLVNRLVKVKEQGEGTKEEGEEALTALGEVITGFFDYLSERKQPLFQGQGLTGVVAETLEEILEQISYYLAVYCYYSESLAEHDRARTIIEEYLTEEGVKRFPQLAAVFLTGELFVTAKLTSKSRSYKIARALAKVSEKNPFQPRDSLSQLVLAELTKVALGKTKPETFSKKVSDKLKEVEQFLC